MTTDNKSIVGISVAALAAVVPTLYFGFLALASFSFTNLKEEQHLSGDVVILVHVRGTVHVAELVIDGQDYSTRSGDRYGDTEATRLSKTVRFDVPTYLFKNGHHLLQIRSGSKVYDQRYVVFQNAKHPG